MMVAFKALLNRPPGVLQSDTLLHPSSQAGLPSLTKENLCSPTTAPYPMLILSTQSPAL